MPKLHSPQKRLHCAVCLRPQSTCICQWIRPTAHAVEVLILQHPLEVANAKGSARLLYLSLPGSQLVVGETFDESSLRALLAGGAGQDSDSSNLLKPAMPAKQAILLYPDTPQDAALGLSRAPALTPEVLRDPARLRLVVLDGTWRKSRKMLYLNPLLQQLPRLTLRDLPPSQYRIRKAHLPDQRSTLEATCAALVQLASGGGKVAEEGAQFAPLLAAFDGFVAQQMGREQSQISQISQISKMPQGRCLVRTPRDLS